MYKDYNELIKDMKTTYSKKSIKNLYCFIEDMEKKTALSDQELNILSSAYKHLENYHKSYEILSLQQKPDTKKLLILSQLIDKYGDQRIIKKPVTKDEIKYDIPLFKYHPDPFRTGAFKIRDDGVKCEICQKMTNIFYSNPFYSIKNYNCICPECIKSGYASKIANGTFQDDASMDEINNKDALEEVTCRTPAYIAWQQGYWLAHCNDYCAFIDYISWQDIVDMGLENEIIVDIKENLEIELDTIKKHMVNGSSMQGYLFQCIHCGQHRLHIDFC